MHLVNIYRVAAVSWTVQGRDMVRVFEVLCMADRFAFEVLCMADRFAFEVLGMADRFAFEILGMADRHLNVLLLLSAISWRVPNFVF